MKAVILAVLAAAGLAGCGVGGPPVRPVSYAEAQAATTPGVRVTGDAIIGIRTDGL